MKFGEFFQPKKLEKVMRKKHKFYTPDWPKFYVLVEIVLNFC